MSPRTRKVFKSLRRELGPKSARTPRELAAQDEDFDCENCFPPLKCLEHRFKDVVDSTPYACHKCDYQTSSKRVLQQHVKAIHYYGLGFKECYVKLAPLKRSKSHGREKYFACEKCDFRASGKRELQQQL